MAIKDGFFNAVKTVDPETEEVSFDRVYDNESMNKYFKGIIRQNGIFSNVGNKLAVKATTGMNIVVDTGKALVGAHWVDVSAPEVLEVPQANIAFPRWDAVMIRFDASLAQRKCSLYIKQGAAYGNEKDDIPAKPVPEGNNNGVFDESGQPVEMPLAYIWVPKGIDHIEQSNIRDQRGASICPYISHLVNGPDARDVDKLLANYMDSFLAWYSQVTEEMNINTYMQEYRKVVRGGSGVSNEINLDMTGYKYDPGDVFFVYYNGLELVKDVEYQIVVGTNMATLVFSGTMASGNMISIKVLKSVIGTPSYLDGDAERY